MNYYSYDRSLIELCQQHFGKKIQKCANKFTGIRKGIAHDCAASSRMILWYQDEASRYAPGIVKGPQPLDYFPALAAAPGQRKAGAAVRHIAPVEIPKIKGFSVIGASRRFPVHFDARADLDGAVTMRLIPAVCRWPEAAFRRLPSESVERRQGPCDRGSSFRRRRPVRRRALVTDPGPDGISRASGSPRRARRTSRRLCPSFCCGSTQGQSPQRPR